ncbi:S-layer homology domain-containing protein [Lysinibacillus pakistanensis]|uniref:S-layer homology domain-containing protein n=1 Tax=Lysinibacillus pakistanensis TaxID=759811 RepID=UPI003D2C2E1F
MEQIKKIMARLLASFILLFMLISGPITNVSASTQPCVTIGDQSNSNYSSLNLGYFDSLTQTFTAKHTTNLTALDIYLQHDLAGSEVWVELLSLSGDDLSLGTVIAQTSSMIQGTGWRTMNFPASVSLVAGQKYAVKVYQVSGNNLVTMLSVSAKEYMDGIFYVEKDAVRQVSNGENMRLRLYMSKGDPNRATANLSGLTLTDNVLRFESDPDNLKYLVITLPSASTITLTPILETPADSYLEINGRSGISGTPYPISVNEGLNNIDFTVIKGDCTEKKTYTVNVVKDTIAPTITGTITPQPNAAGWNNSDVNVRWTVNDSASGIDPMTIPSDRILTAEGDSLQVTGTVKDKAGNSATETVRIKIDRTPPTINGEATKPPNSTGWYNGDVIISWTVSDALSGIDPSTSPSNNVITGEGDNLFVTTSVSDNAGNSTTATVSGIRIDRTAPVTTIVPPVLLSNGTTRLTLTATDTLSGVKQTFYQIDNGNIETGNIVDFKTDGSFVLKAWSEDNAGNVEQAQSIQVDVDQTPPYFIQNYPRLGLIGETTADLLLKTNESGHVFYTVVSNGIAPTAAQVKAGTDALGNLLSANLRGSVAMAGNSEEKISLSGLQKSTKYTIYLVTEDQKSNLMQNVKALSLTTSTPPSANSYTVSFESNGGSIVTDQSVLYNTTLKEPVTTKEGYTFGGWYKDTAFTNTWDFTKDVVTERIILYAKWIMNNSSGGGYIPNPEPNPIPIPIPVESPITEQSVPTPEEPEQPVGMKPTYRFTDISNNWARDMIEDIAGRGIITGYPDGTFRPNESIKRQHIAIMLTRAFELTTKREAVPFSDVPQSHPYYDSITKLQQAGIVDGSNGAFNPNTPMTRAQMAKILVLAFGLTPEGTNTFQDVPATHWSYDYISALADSGIALGDNGNFKPDEPVTRAQFVAFMYRALNL